MKIAVPLVATALAAAVASPTTARAEPARSDAAPAPSSVIVSAPADGLGLRVVAELEAVGLRVVRADLGTGDVTAAALDAAALPGKALAGIRVVPLQRGVEVWIIDRTSGKTVRRVIDADDVAPEVDRAVALRAVDLLRANLLVLAAPAPRPADASSRASSPPAAAVAPIRLRFAVEGGVLASPGGLGPLASVTFTMSWMPGDHLGFFGFAALPLSKTSVDGAAGSADFSALLAGGGVRVVAAPPGSRLSPSLDVGLAVASLVSSGTERPGFVGRDVSALAVAPFLGAGLAFAPTRRLRLRADLLAAVAAEPISLDLGAARAATWGRPLVLPTLGVDFGWF